MEMRRYSVGIIGTGWGAKVQVPAFRAAGWNVRILCGGTNLSRTAQLAEQLGVPFATVSPEEVINREDVDLITICLPPFTHHSIASSAVKAGKHVLCEKPTCLSFEEAADIAMLAESSDRLCLIDHELRCLDMFKKARDAIQSGALGAVLSIKAMFETKGMASRTYHWWYDRAKGGGIFGAVGSHLIDYMSWLVDDEIIRVSADMQTQVRTRNDKDGIDCEVTADDFVNCRFRYREGTPGYMHLNMQCFGVQRKDIVVSCERGTLMLDLQVGTLKIYNADHKAICEVAEEFDDHDGAQKHIWYSGTVALAKEIRACLEEGRDGSSNPFFASFARGKYVRAVMDACSSSSSDDGAWVVPSL